MALIDLDKFVASFITEMKECSQMRNFSISRCIKKALQDQGLEYKDGEIVKSQRRVSAEAKEAGYDESEGEIIRKHLIDCVTRTIPEADAFKEISKEQILAWLEKQGQKPAWTEADENGLGDALWCCKQAASIAKDENDMGDAWYAEQWLKSLKNRIKGG